MRKMKLRGAARYTVMTHGKEPVLRNETIEVDDDVAERLLRESVKDRANTEWPVWEDVTGEGAAEVEKQTVKKTTRRRRAKKVETDEAAA